MWLKAATSIMSKRILMFVAFAALVCANEVEDGEQKKRGAGKGNTLNSIPTGAQKPEYTYQVYQNPSSQASPSSYQPQFPNSFYPSQGSQYYSVPGQPGESSGYSPQPQINLIPPPSTSQFVPINFVPNPGYQSKYQIIPSKSANGNIQLLIQPPPTYQSSAYLNYPQNLFSPNPANQINQHGQFQLSPPGQYNVAPQFQPLSLGQPYLNQPSTMLLLAQPNHYNNLLYSGQNPGQSFYNYYPSNAQQQKYSLSYGSSPQPSVEYEKIQNPVSQSLPKEDNDIGSPGSDFDPSDSNTSYKSAYATSRSGSYSKLK